MADRFIQYELSDSVATITLDRPEKRNAFSENMRRQLIDTWLTFKDDDEADVAILTGSGEVSWSAGSDLREIANGLQIEDPDWRSPVEGAGTIQLATMTGLNINKPVIAAINGYALGFAFGLALACDIRICSPNARFASSEVKYGHMAGGGQATRLARTIPFGMAMELVLTGDQIDAETALRSGIVNQIVPQAELMKEARDLAGRIIECGPIVVRETKEFMYRSLGQPVNEALHMEGLYYERIRKSQDYDEGTQAFAEKRNPEFERR
ncbi:MAG: enoyl-CoA hydratase-related protein [Dehalococcoidia bacterium]|jgi:enoyl-CoA hydratase/carnithine racemase|nr:enoyl-CoA hydratase-related protein [Dehalococcoidia bacterium]